VNPTSFQPERRGILKSKNNSTVNVIFIAKTSDRNFSQNIRSDVETLEVAALHCIVYTWEQR